MQSNVVQPFTKCCTLIWLNPKPKYWTLICVNQWPNDTFYCGTRYYKVVSENSSKVDHYAEKWLRKSLNSKLEQSKEICDEEKFNFIVYMIIFPFLQFVICLIGVAYISYFESGMHGWIARHKSPIGPPVRSSDPHRFQFRNKFF